MRLASLLLLLLAAPPASAQRPVGPETPDDFRVQKVAGILARIFPEAQIGCTR